MALLDAVQTRLLALLAGTYTTGGRYCPASTFVAGEIFLPQQNPRFPSGTASAALNRRFDLHWRALAYEGPNANAENELLSPVVRAADLDLLVQYAITLPPALTPPTTELALGAMAAASQRALNDAALIEWALAWTPNWSGVAVECVRRAPSTTAKRDALCLTLTIPLRILVSQDTSSTPGAWT